MWKFLEACFGKNIERGGRRKGSDKFGGFWLQKSVFKVHKGRINMPFCFNVVFFFLLVEKKGRGNRGRYNLDKKVRKRNLGGGMDAKQKSFVTFS